MQFFRTLDRYERYDRSRPLEHWVSRLALNVCLKALRSRSRRPEWRWSDLSEGEQAVVDSLLHEPDTNTAHASEGRELLVKLLDSLLQQKRVILTLLHLQEKAVAEIAVATGWNAMPINVRAFRGRATMRNALVVIERKNRNPRVTGRWLRVKIPHLLGLDHEKLTYRYTGRDFRLTDVKGHVVKDIVA